MGRGSPGFAWVQLQRRQQLFDNFNPALIQPSLRREGRANQIVFHIPQTAGGYNVQYQIYVSSVIAFKNNYWTELSQEHWNAIIFVMALA